MKKKKPNEILDITFHNPNTSEETVKYLVKAIADNLTFSILERQDIIPCSSRESA